MAQRKDTYSIRQVMDLTGATEFLLRVWENRYAAFQPRRTKTGRRRYSATDVMRAQMLLELTQRGHKIGQIAGLSIEKLKAKMHGPEQADRELDKELPPRVARLFADADAFRWAEVRLQLEKKRQDPDRFIEEVIIPVVVEMGRRVAMQRFTISQEHILTALIKDSLCALVTKPKKKKPAVRMVFAAPEGDYHDLGLFIAAKLAVLSGADVLFLGANMPKAELAETCLKFNASHLIVSSTTTPKEGAREEWLQYLHFLDRNLHDNLKIWLAGRNAQLHPVRLDRAHKIFDSFHVFAQEVTCA